MYLLPFLLIFNNGKPGRPPTSEHQFSIDWVSHSFATPGHLYTHGCFISKPPESWVNSCNKYIVFPGSTWIPPLTPLFFCCWNLGLACWQRAFVWRFVGRLCALSEFSGAAAGGGEKSAVRLTTPWWWFQRFWVNCNMSQHTSPLCKEKAHPPQNDLMSSIHFHELEG